MPKLFRLFNEKIGFPLRWRYLVQRLRPYLKNSKNVLDLGSSCGRLANELSKKLPQIDFIGVDTHVQSKTYIQIKKYDGKKLPFPDNSFDCVMIIDVLHHNKYPEIILREAKRVSKSFILIKDHYYKNKFDFMLLKYADYVGNKPYGIKLPYNFLTTDEWQNLIRNLNLKIIKSEKFRYNNVDPCKHIIFFLQK